MTELWDEFRRDKMQAMAQLPPNTGRAKGKVVYIDTEGTFQPERFRQMADGKVDFTEMAMENIVYAGCYTSGHFARLLLEAASRMVNDKHRFSLLVVDSIMGGFRVDYTGRGTDGQVS
ncbi:RAD51 [Symbiodinium pilosum]|uniref:RAD51 protein n=1 Tax=Symbiodinium pilosum TaxID=2952 RepID=A0A812XTM3_SYMPI|nr:RAD51 [Symbiodinium pilosum]